MIFKHYIQDDRNKQPIFITNLEKFLAIYEAKTKYCFRIKGRSVIERMEQYKQAIDEK